MSRRRRLDPPVFRPPQHARVDRLGDRPHRRHQWEAGQRRQVVGTDRRSPHGDDADEVGGRWVVRGERGELCVDQVGQRRHLGVVDSSSGERVDQALHVQRVAAGSAQCRHLRRAGPASEAGLRQPLHRVVAQRDDAHVADPPLGPEHRQSFAGHARATRQHHPHGQILACCTEAAQAGQRLGIGQVGVIDDHDGQPIGGVFLDPLEHALVGPRCGRLVEREPDRIGQHAPRPVQRELARRRPADPRAGGAQVCSDTAEQRRATEPRRTTDQQRRRRRRRARQPRQLVDEAAARRVVHAPILGIGRRTDLRHLIG